MSEESPDKTRINVAALTPGGMVNHYRIVEKIGAGGMGEVFLAEDTKLDRRVALKFLPSHVAQDSDVRSRFTREAQSVARLDHPNIVTIHEVGEWEGRPYFAMQYIDGKTLYHYSREEKLSIPQMINLVLPIAEGLGKAHSAGVIHRDIKSMNIILDKDLRPTILDFGLASVQGGEILTKAGSTLGTVAYMSPEQARGLEADQRSDLFSLGIVVYELVTGRTPFKMDSDVATMNKIINEEPEPLARYKSDVPGELQRIVSKCLAKSPGERYQSAADLAADLRALSRLLEPGESLSRSRISAAKPSIAVLPFANMSADPENEYFSDGLTEELLNVLAKNHALRVTGRTSSFAFKGKQEDLRGIGQKLGVGTLLEGSVRKAGNRVRITAQLVSVSDGFHLWSETYDRVLDDIFAVQDDIAKAVSKAMHVALVGANDEKKTVNPESYALVLRAHQSTLQMTKESLAVAAELYQKATAVDPNNARAWAGLSYVLGHRIAYGHGDYQADYPRTKAAAEKALALDESLPEAHQAMSFVYAALEMRFKDGWQALRRAHALAPNDSNVVSHMARILAVRGQSDEAVRLANQAIELDPLNSTAHRIRAAVFEFAGRLDEAERAYLRTLELSPEMTGVRSSFSAILLRQGRVQEALEMAQKEILTGYRTCALAVIYHVLGRSADSERALSTLIGEGEQWSFQIAIVHASRGEIDKAFACLERAYELRDSGMPLTRVQPFFESLHSDPRWPMLLEQIGLGD